MYGAGHAEEHLMNPLNVSTEASVPTNLAVECHAGLDLCVFERSMHACMESTYIYISFLRV